MASLQLFKLEFSSASIPVTVRDYDYSFRSVIIFRLITIFSLITEL